MIKGIAKIAKSSNKEIKKRKKKPFSSEINEDKTKIETRKGVARKKKKKRKPIKNQ